MSKPRILFVDDEPGIRATLPRILEMNGFSVRAVGTVPEALRLIAEEDFDALLSDLNIGEPGDGFTVVSAMRRTHPKAWTMIITGYPAFETALNAIRMQVDDYVVKPAPAEELLERIKTMFSKRSFHESLPLKRISYIIEEHLERIVDLFVQEILDHGDMGDKFPVEGLTREEIAGDAYALSAELIAMLRAPSKRFAPGAIAMARVHGRLRAEQGFTPSMVIEEVGLFRSAIFQIVQENLLTVDVSYLVADLARLGAALDLIAKEGVGIHFSEPQLPRAV